MIHQLESSYRLSRRHFDAALDAVKRLHHDISPGLLGAPRTPYTADRSGVSGAAVISSDTLDEALRHWHWMPLYDEPDEMPAEDPTQFDIIELEYTGCKLGDEDHLFAALAPFADEGSFVSVIGEDGKIWRWITREGKCYRQEGRLVYDAPLIKPLRAIYD